MKNETRNLQIIIGEANTGILKHRRRKIALLNVFKKIFNNPGGVILDIRKLDIEFDRLDEIIDGRMKLSLKKSVDIIIVRDEDLIKVLRYNR